MRRRSFLLAAFVSFTGLSRIWAGLSGVARADAPPSPADLRYRNAIRTGLPSLRIADAEVAKFQRAYEAGGKRFRSNQSVGEISTHFLMSSDFFQNGENSKRPVRFVALFDPYENPCYSPMRGLEV